MSSQTLVLRSGNLLTATTIQNRAVTRKTRAITVQPIGTTTASKVVVHLLSSTWACSKCFDWIRKSQF